MGSMLMKNGCSVDVDDDVEISSLNMNTCECYDCSLVGRYICLSISASCVECCVVCGFYGVVNTITYGKMRRIVYIVCRRT